MMKVNQSDELFFKTAADIMENALCHAHSPPTIEEIRASTIPFKAFVDDRFVCSYDSISIPTTDGMSVFARYIRQSKALTPLLIFLPGTGFMHPIFDENYTVAAKLSHFTNLNTLMLEYRLTPEYPYPKPLEDAEAMMAYLIQNWTNLGIEGHQIILSGFSSGGNLAAVLSNTYKDDKRFHILHQYLFSGGFDYTDSLHEFDDYTDLDKMLDKDSAKLSFDLYCGDADRKDPLCSPYWQKDFKHLPPTTIQFGEFDGGRSQSEGYFKKLKNAGCAVSRVIMPGQTHFTLLYRKACSDGEDPIILAANRIKKML